MALKLPTFSRKAKSEAPVSSPAASPTAKSKSPAAKTKAFKAARGEKFVLFVGDEGAILVFIKNNVVLSRQYVPDASQPNLDDLQQTLEKNIKAPIMMVIDSLDQTFVQQTLPPVSSMSVGKLIKKRLDRDFAANDIKGAIILGRDKTGRKDWNFMMIALEKSPQLKIWLDFMTAVKNRFTGIYLVSVEAETMIKSLEQAMGIAKITGGAEWKFLVSHNKVGGFRQVILRNGKIAFTRLAQPVGEANPEVIAGNIEQEMINTIEYMKRLSYNPASGLDIFIIASAAIKEAIDVSKFDATTLHMLTPFEVAQYLNIEGATQPTDQFGDVVLAAIIGCSSKHILKLAVPQSKVLDNYYQLLTMQRVIGSACILSLLGYALYSGYELYDQITMLGEFEREKQMEQRKLDELKMEIHKSNLDIDKVSDIIDLYKGLRDELTSPLPFILKLEKGRNEQGQPILMAPIRIEAFEWALDTTTVVTGKRGRSRKAHTAADPAGGNKIIPQMLTNLTLELPTVIDDPKGLQTIKKKVLADFNGVFKAPSYQVSFPEKEAVEKEKTDNLEINFNQQKTETSPTAAVATHQLKIIIKGPAIDTAGTMPAAVTPAVPNPVLPSPPNG
jgi:hypothetical protein